MILDAHGHLFIGYSHNISCLLLHLHIVFERRDSDATAQSGRICENPFSYVMAKIPSFIKDL